MNKYGSKEARKDRYDREKKFQKGEITRKVYREVIIWVG